MTLLTIGTAIADEVGIARPSSLIASAEPDSQAILRYANRVGVRLMRAFPWQILRKELTFTSLATEAQTAVPSDFDRIVAETFWDRTDQIIISGPISASQWQGLKAVSYADTSLPKFAFRGDNIIVQPTLTAGNTLAFEYVSNQWCQSAALAAQAVWVADTDLGILDEDLMIAGAKFMYLTDRGLPNEVAAADFNDYFSTLANNDAPGTPILQAGDIFGGARHAPDAPPTTGISWR